MRTSSPGKKRRAFTRGALIAAALAALAAAGALRLYPFLACERPAQDAEILVIEGWLSDHALDRAVDVWREGGYDRIVTAGGPHRYGSSLMPWPTYAQATRARLIERGVPASRILAAPARKVRRNRTYAAACRVGETLAGLCPAGAAVDVLSVGAHARRSRYLYRLALADRHPVGVRSIVPEAYEPARWHTCSEGVREVIGEMLAYGYARLFFRPPAACREGLAEAPAAGTDTAQTGGGVPHGER
ncbi:ElyC/SanA/YdcF family protein [Kiritimatiella glycovorans]|uniref:Uncharacterized protein n=1 Tax=Kiritimatiella glycovorans TaxID=1307763 RepID=A0A0G3EDX0_9BACT|nr:ElyC/SanA/YdcF family protein [Kiritimatiella glycovorans]AKJ64656.1 hypothetical protein L21SP4_01409 [Kiritimatiella glycovorans]